MIIYLIGFMGSGKSTLGRPLANRLGYSFVDLDEQIETHSGCKIADIFAQYGEEYFRNLESQYLKEIAANKSNLVVSTGGGVPCFNNNMELMNASGVTIYLNLSPKMLADRLSNARATRPLIASKSSDELLQYITQTLAARDEFYSKANVIIANPSRDVSQIVTVISPYLDGKHSLKN